MSYADALADLKIQFPGKTLLTPQDLAPVLAASVGAQAQMRRRKTFPLPVKKGSRIKVSIYAVARYLGEDDEPAEPKASPAKSSATKKSVGPARGRETVKTRRPAPIGQLLRMVHKNIAEDRLRMDFQLAIAAELERMEIEKAAKKADAKRSSARRAKRL